VTNNASVSVAEDTDISNNVSSRTSAVTAMTTNSGAPIGINAPAAVTFTSDGMPPAPSVGYGRIQAAPGNVTPYGVAIFAARERGIIVSEAGVPATPLIQTGRISVGEGATRTTGIAFANPNDEPATVTFFFTSNGGRDVAHGTFDIDRNAQLARFFAEAPFNLQRPFEGTFTFTSSRPVGIVALRGLVNESAQFLMTSLPVVPLLPAEKTPTTIPHFADGGGWKTEVILVNPSDEPLDGTIYFLDQHGNRSLQPTAYAIAPRGQQLIETDGRGLGITTGSIRISPSSRSMPPHGQAIVSLRRNDMTMAVAGFTASPSGAAFRLYAEARGHFAAGEAGSVQTGIAIANPSAENLTVHFEMLRPDGVLVAPPASKEIPGYGQIAVFLRELPGFDNLPPHIEGVLRIWTRPGTAVSAMGFRGHYNERGDFLITSTPPADEAVAPTSAERIFPHIVNGGGFTTEIILFSPSVQAASGTLRVLSQRGDTLDMELR
jgi:hypothetical protein